MLDMMYLLATVLGAIVGGLVTLVVGAVASRRERRARYGEALMAALGSAHMKIHVALAKMELAQSSHDRFGLGAFVLREEAVRIWAQAQLASTIEWARPARRAMRSWADHLHETMSAGADTPDQLKDLEHQLSIGEYLVVAWVTGEAGGRDFNRSCDEIEQAFAPDHVDTPFTNHSTER